MKDDFEDKTYITLQPGSYANPYRFAFTPAVSVDSKGSIPFGTHVSSVAVSAFDIEEGINVSAQMIENVSENADVVTVALNWPGSAGTYKLKFLLTLDNGAVFEKDFNRVEAEDL